MPYGYYNGYGDFLANNIYCILLIPVLILSLWAQTQVSGNFKRYSGVANRRRLTGAQAAEAVLALRDSLLPDLRLVGVLAWEERTNEWPEPDRDRFFAVMERSDEEVLLQTAYTAGALERHRAYLLQNSDCCLTAE